MMLNDFANKLFTQHPTRMWRKEKAAFLSTCREIFIKTGYAESEINVREAPNALGLTSRNFIVGREDADILITAHYDTPGNNGFLPALPSFLDKIGGQVIIVMIAAMAGLYIRFFTDIHIPLRYRFAFAAAVIAITFGSALVKNKHNHNDNTSGVLGVVALASRLVKTPHLRGKCAFVLFDHEEVFPCLLGSKAFVKQHKAAYPDKRVQVINLDCIGNGEVLTVETKKPHTFHNRMAAHLKKEGYDVSVKGKMGSDHESFDTGLSLGFQRYSRFGNLYTPLIHTRKDTVCDIGKIERLCASVHTFLEQEAARA